MSIINDAIFISHMNNNASNSNFGLKISGKGLYDTYNLNNLYDCNGIGFQLINNVVDNREFAFVDTANLNNPSLNFNFKPSQISIKSSKNININSNLFITNNNRIGIGTNDPQASLHIYSSNQPSLMITNDFSNAFTITKIGRHINIDNSNGYIGIGTLEPTNFLDIRGNVVIPNSKLGIGTNNPRASLDVIGNCIISCNLELSNLILNGNIYKSDGSLLLINQWSNISNSTNIFYNSGKVGIGTTNPQNLLDVIGRISCFDINIGGTILTKEIVESSGTNIDVINTGTLKVIYGGTGINNFNSNQLLIGNGSNPIIQTSNLIWSNNSLLINGDVYITSNCYISSNILISGGKLGLGTTNPLSSIHIQSGSNESATIRIGDISLIKSNQDFIISNSLPTGKIIIGNLFINSSGLVGIGVTNPLFKLDVLGNVNINGTLNMSNFNISNANIIDTKTLNISNIILSNAGTITKRDGTPYYASRWEPNSTNIFTLSNVGIGTTNPLFKLDVLGNVNINGTLIMSNFNISNANIIDTRTLNVSNIVLSNAGTITKRDGNPFYASRWDTNSINIFTLSNVGIGTTNTLFKLDVLGNVNINGILNMSNNNIINVNIIDTKTLNVNNISLKNNGSIRDNTGAVLNITPTFFQTSGNNIYTMSNVGIGITNPLATLDIKGNLNINGNLRYNNSNIFTYLSTIDKEPFTSSTINNNANYINFIGNVGIGNTIANSNIFIYGNTYIRGSQYIQPNNDGNAMIFSFNNNIIQQNTNNNDNINFKLGAISSGIVNPYITVYNRYQTSSSFNSAVKIEGGSTASILIDGGTILGVGSISFKNNNIDTMSINSNIVNINNCLNISGNSGTNVSAGGAFFTSVSSAFSSGFSNTNATFSLKTSDNIICGKNSYALSDMRIKKNICDINDNEALLKIMRIEPKTYNYIDTIQRTSSNVYGFIAQQIREVIPEAVELISKFIPNIYKLVTINKNKFILDDIKDLKNGDILQIYTLNSIDEVTIIQINLNEITIDKKYMENQIFIYGSYVNDFHILDKSYLYTLNVCATQQIYKDLCLLTSNLDYKTNMNS